MNNSYEDLENEMIQYSDSENESENDSENEPENESESEHYHFKVDFDLFTAVANILRS